MFLKLSFTEDNPLKPRAFVVVQGHEHELRRDRWVQFLSLLVFRRLTGVEDGWVNLEDVCNLSAYHNSKPKVIGKYLATSRFEFSLDITRFLNRTIDITTTGPYKLILGRDRIFTELAALEQYIAMIDLKPSPPKTDGQSLWQAAQLTFDKYELNSCMEILQRFIDFAKTGGNIPAYQLPLAYIRLVRVERLSRRNIVDIDKSLERAKSLASKLKSPYERNILQAYAIAVEALHLAKNSDTYPEIFQLNQTAINLLKEIRKTTPDKLCLLGAIHYNNYSAAIFNNPESYSEAVRQKSQKDLELSLKCYKQADKLGKPQLVNVEDGIIEGIELLSILIHKVLAKETVSHAELKRYEDLLQDRRISKLQTLIQGEWIRRNFLVNNEPEKAFDFGQECLIEHAQLYETAAFQAMVKEQEKLKEKLRLME